MNISFWILIVIINWNNSLYNCYSQYAIFIMSNNSIILLFLEESFTKTKIVYYYHEFFSFICTHFSYILRLILNKHWTFLYCQQVNTDSYWFETKTKLIRAAVAGKKKLFFLFSVFSKQQVRREKNNWLTKSVKRNCVCFFLFNI